MRTKTDIEYDVVSSIDHQNEPCLNELCQKPRKTSNFKIFAATSKKVVLERHVTFGENGLQAGLRPSELWQLLHISGRGRRLPRDPSHNVFIGMVRKKTLHVDPAEVLPLWRKSGVES